MIENKYASKGKKRKLETGDSTKPKVSKFQKTSVDNKGLSPKAPTTLKKSFSDESKSGKKGKKNQKSPQRSKLNSPKNRIDSSKKGSRRQGNALRKPESPKKKVTFSPKPEYFKTNKGSKKDAKVKLEKPMQEHISIQTAKGENYKSKFKKKGDKSNKFTIKTEENEKSKTKFQKKGDKGNKFSIKTEKSKFQKKGDKNKTASIKTEKIEETKIKLHELKFKKRKILRKQQDNIDHFNLASKAKAIWEELRREDCEDEKRKILVSRLLNLVKGHLKDLIFAHDTVRVIECLAKHASVDQNTVIFGELKDSILLLAQNKYAKFYLVTVLRRGTKEEKDEIVKAFMGKVLKNIRHVEAASVLEMAYNEHAKAKQRIQLLQEFYGPTFAVFKDQEITSLKDVLEKNPEQRGSILKHMNEILIKLTDKSVVRHSMVHHVLKEYLALATPESRAEVIEAYKENLPEILHTRDGARSAMECIWHGSTKDRKTIVKSMKSYGLKIAKEEHGHMVLLALFDCIDDTKLVEKTILNELIPHIEELVADPFGRKVLLYLISPRDSLHFHPDIIEILKKGDGNPTSKKDTVIRRKELNNMIANPLLDFLTQNVPTLLQSNFNCLFVLTVLHNVQDPSQGYKAVATHLLSKPYSSPKGNEIHLFDHPGFGLLIKKLLKHDSKLTDNKNIAFSDVLTELSTPKILKSWIECNRGCFCLLQMLEMERPAVTACVQEAMKEMHKKISAKTYKGAELLLKKLKN